MKPAAIRRHFARLGEMTCLTCGRYGVHLHHVVSDGYQRLTKRDDRVVPLCPGCHTDGPFAVHKVGQMAFNVAHGVDLMAEAARLWEESNGA